MPGPLGATLDRDVATEEPRDAAAYRQSDSRTVLRLGIEARGLPKL